MTVSAKLKCAKLSITTSNVTLSMTIFSKMKLDPECRLCSVYLMLIVKINSIMQRVVMLSVAESVNLLQHWSLVPDIDPVSLRLRQEQHPGVKVIKLFSFVTGDEAY